MLTEGIIAALSAGIGALGVVIVNVIKANKSKNEVRGQEYEHTENLVKLSSNMVQEIGNLKNEMNSKFEELNERIDGTKEDVIQLTKTQAEFNKMYLRHAILRVYFSYDKEKKIPESQYESVLGLYDVYNSLGGNGFVHEKIEELKKWERY